MTTGHDLPTIRVPQWSLGDRLRKARLEAGIERAEMAADIGVTPTTISNYELDSVRVPKLVVIRYATRCGVPYEWLVSGNFRTEPLRVTHSDCYPVLSGLLEVA